jgi:hypothetical protein
MRSILATPAARILRKSRILRGNGTLTHYRGLRDDGMHGHRGRGSTCDPSFHDASATLHEVAEMQGHLAAQDVLLSRIAEKIGLDPVPVIDTPQDADAGPGDQVCSADRLEPDCGVGGL